MRRIRRQTISLAAAVMLPLLILTGLQLYDGVNTRRLELEALSRARAGEIMRLVDAQVMAEVRLGRVLSLADSIKQDDAARAHGRAREFREAAGSWRTVRLSDPHAGLELFDLRRPASAQPRAAGPDVAALGRKPFTAMVVEGVVRDAGAHGIALHMPILRDGQLRYILTVELDPRAFHNIAAPRYPAETVVAAVVDRSGRFISRSLRYEATVGHPGSAQLREAVLRGGEGFYRNVTLEGVPTYTGYVTSPLTGWSTHVAVSSSPFEAARYWSMAIWVVVVLGCLALSGLMIGLTLRDMDQVRREDEGLRQAQKMEALGHLTGGIAHDFNNLLTAIIGSLDLVLRRAPAEDPNRRYLEGALDAAQRGAKLTSRLLAFSRTQKLGVEPVDIAATLDGMSELLDQSLGPGVAIRVQVAPEARWVSTDRNQLELALLNLAVNARDAMPEGGRLTFTGALVDHRRAGKATPRVVLAVSDTGQGMTSEVLHQAFDPFFTTKAVSKGTGLGLAQVYAFARQCGGEVKIHSEVGKGTRVELILPAASEVASAPAIAAPEPVLADGRRILVLDDDESVRQVLVENLRARGYVVFQAANGEDALNALADIDPDLFVLDFLMPGLNGAEVARRARQMRPHQKLLVVSGHLDSVALEGAIEGVAILQKPFDGPTLALRVAEVLKGTGA
ncbi:MAG: response regulator [Phenylobacterium sp.]|uniref:ATP-binding protein n=1 Tax=Phenylobacterium sp. TaxID=1871053 RepID=UPI0027264FDC|nr:ATP-binding protein [Phenylobacterium sp.]MDO8911281.1 response regulator [Phenylobacterium sp.]MDP3099216.1 response regulator [Phenylobacterium sp.]